MVTKWSQSGLIFKFFCRLTLLQTRLAHLEVQIVLMSFAFIRDYQSILSRFVCQRQILKVFRFETRMSLSIYHVRNKPADVKVRDSQEDIGLILVHFNAILGAKALGSLGPESLSRPSILARKGRQDFHEFHTFQTWSQSVDLVRTSLESKEIATL